MKRGIFFTFPRFFITISFLVTTIGHSHCIAHAEEKTIPEEAVINRTLEPYPKLPYKEFVFAPGQIPSSHSPSIVESPDGELFAVWYAPTPFSPNSVIWGSRKPVGACKWTAPSLIHHTLGCSNKNPVLYLAQNKKLWLFWSDEKRWLKWVKDKLRVKISEDFGHTWSKARDAGVPTGFLPRTNPIRLHDGSVILPLYTDWNTSSALVISRDDCLTWERPIYILFLFGIQPTIIQRSDSSLFALMRSGMPPRLAWQATSDDLGRSWKHQKFSTINNPGTSLEMIKLQNGHVVLAFNDSKTDRSSLSLALSCDDGRSWPYTRVIEFKSGSVHTYPSIIQDKQGLIHVLYSYDGRISIAHFVTDEQWIKEAR